MTDVEGTLAKFLSDVDSRLSGGRGHGLGHGHGKKDKERSRDTPSTSPTSSPNTSQIQKGGSGSSTATGPLPAGVFAASPHQRLSVLNGSHHSLAADADTHATVLVFPDYVALSSVPETVTGADALWRHACDPAVPRAGTHVSSLADEGSRGEDTEAEFKTWPLPYNCVILLCE